MDDTISKNKKGKPQTCKNKTKKLIQLIANIFELKNTYFSYAAKMECHEDKTINLLAILLLPYDSKFPRLKNFIYHF